jgi:hypothetical protein
MPSLRTLPADLRLFAKYHLRRRVYDYPARETELGVFDLGFELDAFAARMKSAGAGREVECLDRPRYRDRDYPIFCVATRREGTRRTLLVLGGVHGNEHAGILAVPEILERFAQPEVRLVAIAPVNPVGAAQMSRYNAGGFDVNRDFVRFETPEARAVRTVLQREKPDFVVSLHEGPQEGTFMFLNRLVDLPLACRLADRLAAGGTRLATKDYFGRTLRPPGVAAKSRALSVIESLWAATLGMKATGVWCEGFGIPEITLESSWSSNDRKSRVRAHVDLVLGLAAELARAADGGTRSAGTDR